MNLSMNSMWTTAEGFSANHAFSTRCGGVSPEPFHSLDLSLQNGDLPERVGENARRLADSLGLPLENIAAVRQVHGTRILQIKAAASESEQSEQWSEPKKTPELLHENRDVLFWNLGSHGRSAANHTREARGLPEPICDADGLVTDVPGIALAIRTADCAPVLIASKNPRNPAVAAVHAGWRGTFGKIAEGAIQLMRERFGILPEDLCAAIGPCIGSCCYEVSPSLAADFREKIGGECVIQRPDGSFRLDLKTANKIVLTQAGIAAGDIHISPWCTSCRRDLFFSYRRDKGQTGRHLSLIWI